MIFKNTVSLNKVDIIPNILVFLFLGAYILRFFTDLNIYVGNVLIVLVGLTSYFYAIIFSKTSVKILNLSFVFLLFGIISMIFTDNTSVGELLLLFSYQGIAQIFISYNIRAKMISRIYYSMIIFFFLNVFNGTNPEALLNTASNNHISVILISILILYYIILLREAKRLPIIPLVFALIIILWTTSRSGILTAGLLFTGILMLRNQKDKIKLRSPLIFLSILLFFYFVVYNFFYDIAIGPVINRFALEGTESSRFYIWRSYLELTVSSLQNILFGTPYESNHYFVLYSRNLHNTFFQVHSRFGVVVLIVLLYTIAKSTIYYLKKQKYYHVLFLIVLFLRSFTDFTSFPEIFDIAWYCLFFERYIRLELKDSIQSKNRREVSIK